MNPGTVTAIAYLISEAVAAGVSVAAIVREARAQGKVPDARWDQILEELDREVAAWRAKA